MLGKPPTLAKSQQTVQECSCVWSGGYSRCRALDSANKLSVWDNLSSANVSHVWASTYKGGRRARQLYAFVYTLFLCIMLRSFNNTLII